MNESKLKAFEKKAVKEFLDLDERLDPESEKVDTEMSIWVGEQMDKAYVYHVKQHDWPYSFDYIKTAKKLIKQWDRDHKKE